MKHYEKRLKVLLLEVIEEAVRLNIPISDNICPDVLVNKRAKKRFGACKSIIKNKEKHFQIEIGSALSVLGDKDIKNVLMHEILHSCPGCNNHGSLWKKYAAVVNDHYGYNIKRTSTYEEIGIVEEKKNISPRYAIVCSNCGGVWYRMKKSAIVKNPQRYRCRCGGKISVKVVGKDIE